MAKKINYTQVSLTKRIEDSRAYEVHVAWIPSKYAKEGKYLRFKATEGNWTSGWKVTEVYETKPLTGKELAEMEGRWKEHRKGSDV